MSQRPRVGIDFHVWDGIYQGSRSHILGIYREAISIAPDIEFVFFLEGVEEFRSRNPDFLRPNVKIKRMKTRSALVRLFFQIPRLKKRESIDIMHLQYRIPLFAGGSYACTIHDVLFETHPQYFGRIFTLQSKFFFRIAARLSRLLFTVSEFSKSEIVRLYGINPKKISVTYNGVDRDRFYPGEDGKELLEQFQLRAREYILTVGRIEPRKNHESLIRAYARLGSSAPPLVIVGQPDNFGERIFGLVRELDVEDKVKFLHSVDDALLPAILRNCRFFAYPAFAEGFGMPVVEALASGVPVITSRSTSLIEVAGNGALLVDPNSVDQIHAALDELLRNSELSQQLIAKGLMQVEKFSWKKSAEVLVSGIKEHLRG